MRGVYFSDPPRMPTVLIADEDIAFVWWLGEILIEAGCTVVPALTCDDAISLAQDLHVKVDLMFVNPSMNGATEMITTMADIRKLVRVAETTEPAV